MNNKLTLFAALGLISNSQATNSTCSMLVSRYEDEHCTQLKTSASAPYQSGHLQLQMDINHQFWSPSANDGSTKGFEVNVCDPAKYVAVTQYSDDECTQININNPVLAYAPGVCTKETITLTDTRYWCDSQNPFKPYGAWVMGTSPWVSTHNDGTHDWSWQYSGANIVLDPVTNTLIPYEYPRWESPTNSTLIYDPYGTYWVEQQSAISYLTLPATDPTTGIQYENKVWRGFRNTVGQWQGCAFVRYGPTGYDAFYDTTGTYKIETGQPSGDPRNGYLVLDPSGSQHYVLYNTISGFIRNEWVKMTNVYMSGNKYGINADDAWTIFWCNSLFFGTCDAE